MTTPHDEPRPRHLGEPTAADAARHHVARADWFSGRRMFDRAIPEYQAALAADPRCAEAYAGWGSVLRCTGKNERAVELIREAIALQPANAYFFSALMFPLMILGRQSEAEAAILEARRLEPARVEWILLHARMLMRDHARALEAAREARRLDPTNTEAADLEARSLIGLGRPAEAIPLLELLLPRSPDDFNLHYQLGTAYVAVGNPESAIPHLAAAARLDPTAGYAQDALDDAVRRRGRLYCLHHAMRDGFRARQRLRAFTRQRLLAATVAPALLADFYPPAAWLALPVAAVCWAYGWLMNGDELFNHHLRRDPIARGLMTAHDRRRRRAVVGLFCLSAAAGVAALWCPVWLTVAVPAATYFPRYFVSGMGRGRYGMGFLYEDTLRRRGILFRYPFLSLYLAAYEPAAVCPLLAVASGACDLFGVRPGAFAADGPSLLACFVILVLLGGLMVRACRHRVFVPKQKR